MVDEFLERTFSERSAESVWVRFKHEAGRSERPAQATAPVATAATARFSVPPRSSGNGRVLAALSALVLLAMFIWWRPRAPDGWALELSPGSAGALVAAGGASRHRLGPGESASVVGDRPAELRMGTALVLVAKPGACLAVNKLGDPSAGAPVELVQRSGVVVYDLAAGAHLPLSVILPGGARIRATGTRWRIVVSEAGADVAVGQGAVEVESGGRTQDVRSGRRLTIDPEEGASAVTSFVVLADPDFGASERVPTGSSR